jgi:hypothetical protein
MRQILFTGLIALSLLSGTVASAQTPQPPQAPVGGGEAHNNACPKVEDNSSIGVGTWVIIGIVVLVIIWLANQKGEGPSAPLPIPILLRGGPKPKNSSGALWCWVGLALLALVIYGCVSEKPKPAAPPNPATQWNNK